MQNFELNYGDLCVSVRTTHMIFKINYEKTYNIYKGKNCKMCQNDILIYCDIKNGVHSFFRIKDGYNIMLHSLYFSNYLIKKL